MNVDAPRDTRGPFVAAIRQVKKAQGIHLSQQITREQRSALLTQAFREQDVVSHLTRDYTALTVAAGVPQLSLPAPEQAKDKAAKCASDYHERQLYQHIHASRRVPFRGEPSVAFTTLGAYPSEFEALFGEFATEAAPMRHIVTRPLHRTDLRPLISALAFTPLPLEQQPRFVMTPVWEDRHALGVLTVYEPSTRTPLMAIFLNSVRDTGRFHYVADAFQGNANETRLPILDASHALQVSSTDHNCTIYNYNLLRGVSAMLSDEGVAARVLALATTINARDWIAVEPLRQIFCEDVKVHLPQYYDAAGRAHPQGVLDAYNARTRWELGARTIRLLAEELGPRKG